MDGEDKGMELMEPLNGTGSFKTDSDLGDQGFTARDHPVEHREETIGPENTGRFGIGPKKLAKFADTDGSHTSAPGRDS